MQARQDSPLGAPLDSAATGDGAAGPAVYDSVWATTTGVPDAPPVGLERVMLQQEKLYVVLGVVLIIWFGLLFFLFRTDRRIARLERALDEQEPRT